VGAEAIEPALAAELAGRYDLNRVQLRRLDVAVNDVYAVTAEEGAYALKLYHHGRTPAAVQWELDLVDQVSQRGAPVVPPIRARTGLLQRFPVTGRERIGALFTWATGVKPAPGPEVYHRLGAAAAQMHRAADDFAPSPDGEAYDAALLIDEQLDRMRPLLQEAGCWTPLTALADRLRRHLTDPALDVGICHMDLSLDNVHESEDGTLTVFDFDSAGPSWRAVEPWGVLRYSTDAFRSWLAAYRGVRTFSPADEAAVAVFGIVGDLRAVAWQLGVAVSSRGTPLLDAAALPAIVDGWLDWEATHLTS
jgi:Ser/Thr protein kinase RdoA (MazF antagonist)